MGYSIEGLPSDILTSERLSTRRLRVDVAETGFFENREFRISQELNIATGTTLVYRFRSPIDFILQLQALDIDQGAVRFRAFRSEQGTPGGTFTDIPMLRVNGMTDAPEYARQARVARGGTFAPTAGQESVETLRVRSANATAQQSTVTASPGDQRGLPPGDYYLLIENIGNGVATGVYTLRWEERPSS